MLKFLKTPFLFVHFTYYTLITFLMMLAVILLSMLMILLAIPRYSTCDQSSDLWHQLEITAELESDLQDTVDWGRKWLVDSNNGKTQLVFLTGLITPVLLMWNWMGLFLMKNHLFRCWGWLSLLILLTWIRALILSLLLKLPPRKLKPWFVLWSFFLRGCSVFL